jgi:hypothetical protein
MVRRDGAADLVLVVATGIGADVDAGDELDPVEIGEAAMRRAACASGDMSLSEIPRAEFSMPRTRLRPMLAQSGPLGL